MQEVNDIINGYHKAKLFMAFLPVIGIIFIVILIVAILGSTFSTAYTEETFVLPFNCKNYRVTCNFGGRIDPVNGKADNHTGIDVVPACTDIVAVASGTVIKSEAHPYNGEHVVIEHKIGNDVYRTGYYHMRENSRVVTVGQNVKQGDKLGIVGATGHVTGVHLHFELQHLKIDDKGKTKFVFENPNSIIK